jgi:hypothetical protein
MLQTSVVSGIQPITTVMREDVGTIAIKQAVQLLDVYGIQTVIIVTKKVVGNTMQMLHVLTHRIH